MSKFRTKCSAIIGVILVCWGIACDRNPTNTSAGGTSSTNPATAGNSPSASTSSAPPATQSDATPSHIGSPPVSSAVPKIEVPPLGWEALMLVEKENLQHWFIAPPADVKAGKWDLKTGELRGEFKTYYDCAFPDAEGATKIGDAYMEARNMRCLVVPEPLTEADRLNGIEWSGRVEFTARLSRSYTPANRLRGGTSPGWSDWEQREIDLIRRKAVKKNGSWTIEKVFFNQFTEKGSVDQGTPARALPIK